VKNRLLSGLTQTPLEKEPASRLKTKKLPFEPDPDSKPKSSLSSLLHTKPPFRACSILETKRPPFEPATRHASQPKSADFQVHRACKIRGVWFCCVASPQATLIHLSVVFNYENHRFHDPENLRIFFFFENQTISGITCSNKCGTCFHQSMSLQICNFAS